VWVWCDFALREGGTLGGRVLRSRERNSVGKWACCKVPWSVPERVVLSIGVVRVIVWERARMGDPPQIVVFV